MLIGLKRNGMVMLKYINNYHVHINNIFCKFVGIF